MILIHIEKFDRDGEGKLIAFFRHLDNITKRPTGEVLISSQLKSIELVKDAYGAIHDENEASIILTTLSGSVYMAVLPKTVINQLSALSKENLGQGKFLLHFINFEKFLHQKV